MTYSSYFQFQPWQHKKGSVERGEVWGNIACHLGRSSDPVFRVTQIPAS